MTQFLKYYRMGGDSGSAWLIADSNNNATNVMVGLHFAGESAGDPYEHALVCYAKSVFEKLGVMPSPMQENREIKIVGYQENFLQTDVLFPVPIDKDLFFKLDNSIIIDYQHFSLALNKYRKFAACVGWNIDGSNMKKLSRKGIRFRTDRRIPDNYQVNNRLYKNNSLDRGHIARRADLLWGNIENAQQANSDSFYYTNITPQINDFNQSGKEGIWGKLENAVFEDIQVDNLRVSIFGGPIFQTGDRLYRDVQIPSEFYKVVIYVEKGKLKHKAFVLSQNIDRLEYMELEKFKVYEVPLTLIEERIGFTFDHSLYTTQTEGFEPQQSPKIVSSLNEIVW